MTFSHRPCRAKGTNGLIRPASLMTCIHPPPPRRPPTRPSSSPSSFSSRIPLSCIPTHPSWRPTQPLSGTVPSRKPQAMAPALRRRMARGQTRPAALVLQHHQQGMQPAPMPLVVLAHLLVTPHQARTRRRRPSNPVPSRRPRTFPSRTFSTRWTTMRRL